VESYSRFFLEYDVAPVLIVNAAEIDLVGSDRDYRGLLAEVARARRGRHYFNPMKSLL
jgi:deoxyadenosine/deoxycytidine kinase